MTADGELPAGRRNGKSETAFRTISEVADDLDVPQHVLRFWESKFPQVKPLKRGGGRRYYRPEDVALLRRIRDLLYSEGYTIKGVQKLLREGLHRDVAAGVARSEPELQLSLPGGTAAAVGVDAEEIESGVDGGGDEDSTFALMDDGEESDPLEVELEALEAEAVSPIPAVAPALRAEIRQELELLLDELEQMRSLLHFGQR